MSYNKFDAFVNEAKAVNGKEVEPKGFELFNVKFDLPDTMPALEVLEYGRMVETNNLMTMLAAQAMLLKVLLGEEQYATLRQLALEHNLSVEQIFLLINKIMQLYSATEEQEDGQDSKNARKVLRGKTRVR